MVLGFFICNVKTSRNLKFEKSDRVAMEEKIIYDNIAKELNPFGPISAYALGYEDCTKPKIFKFLNVLFCSLVSS